MNMNSKRIDFLPARLRKRRDIELPAKARGTFHTLAQAALDAMRIGDSRLATYFADQAAIVAAIGGAE